ncbi:MAG: DUF452 family protein [Muribaculaceae bacterium]|nr:DUF452 family protein [Muribaculaceae bacterium]
MKIEFIKRGAATRLILIFAGWSTDSRYYNDCVFDGWDTAVVCDYRDMTLPPLPSQYSTVYVFAYSLGVAVSAFCGVAATAMIAICGSLEPVSDQFGIPETVYQGTLAGLSEKSLAKFHLRMAGDRDRLAEIAGRLPSSPDLEVMKEELGHIRSAALSGQRSKDIKFDRVYLAEDDRIFPYANLYDFWNQRNDASIVSLKASHAVDMARIIRSCLPDTEAIGEGFQRAGKSYNENALIQREICRKIAERLQERLTEDKRDGICLLEIGPGQGLLTEEWRKMLRPKSATYVDLAEVPCFGIAQEETYLQTDAEQWLEDTSRKFDIILSASTIQWFADPIGFITTVRAHLNPGGIAILSTFVKGNLHQLDALRPSPILYRTAEEYAAAPAEILDEWKSTLRFQSSREMMRHLSLTGVSPRGKKQLSLSDDRGKGELPKHHSLLPLELTFCPLLLFIKA